MDERVENCIRIAKEIAKERENNFWIGPNSVMIPKESLFHSIFKECSIGYNNSDTFPIRYFVFIDGVEFFSLEAEPWEDKEETDGNSNS
jgi:hypothetical protein